jgi:hypothetical protein
MGGLRTAARTVENGWIVDIALPAEVLMRRRPGNRLRPMKLRANFLRYERLPAGDSTKKRKAVFMNWSPVNWGQPHRSPQRMGHVRLAE